MKQALSIAGAPTFRETTSENRQHEPPTAIVLDVGMDRHDESVSIFGTRESLQNQESMPSL